ncbi:Gfo/Idh/MocA family oxidoreductase [Adhaeribacter swui]|uniref:Gfo/Idh/MocA family oxidoreductase n=1 Tax=Adhaeribacter swui TaxID=2086471 RepID=A0A7G7G8L8_9BACT|nr:Gfo/Idh/MocA family oxidoreductase [Adhaeribacter swui]QNF33502.1 Gfo/Idh/MocA family oxidoreductase [Adhaeribacter swui]
MHQNFNRREFIKTAAVASVGIGLNLNSGLVLGKEKGKRVGIIGLDTSHSVAFTKELNNPNAQDKYGGYKIVAAYPKGSEKIESSTKRIPGYIEEVKKHGVKISGSIKDLLKEVDVVLLETNDGHPRLEQAMEVLKAGKPMFIDKPVAASLRDVMTIYEEAKKRKVPLFSSSSLRYMPSAQEAAQGKEGKILGADTYGPASLEPSHPDLFWYGIHGVETLFTIMGKGCQSVTRTQTENTELVVGVWEDGRIGTFRGTRNGKADYGGTAYAEKGNITLGQFGGYNPLLEQIIKFFETGQTPVDPEDTLEIYAFMEASDESKRQGGKSITLASVMEKAKV